MAIGRGLHSLLSARAWPRTRSCPTHFLCVDVVGALGPTLDDMAARNAYRRDAKHALDFPSLYDFLSRAAEGSVQEISASMGTPAQLVREIDRHVFANVLARQNASSKQQHARPAGTASAPR